MVFTVVRRTAETSGVRLEVEADGRRLDLLFLWHSISRMRRWRLPEARVIETLLFPEEVRLGHRGRFIAHRRYGNHLVRAVYSYEDAVPVLVTVYYPFSERYFEGGNHYADHILS